MGQFVTSHCEWVNSSSPEQGYTINSTTANQHMLEYIASAIFGFISDEYQITEELFQIPDPDPPDSNSPNPNDDSLQKTHLLNTRFSVPLVFPSVLPTNWLFQYLSNPEINDENPGFVSDRLQAIIPIEGFATKLIHFFDISMYNKSSIVLSCMHEMLMRTLESPTHVPDAHVEEDLLFNYKLCDNFDGKLKKKDVKSQASISNLRYLLFHLLLVEYFEPKFTSLEVKSIIQENLDVFRNYCDTTSSFQLINASFMKFLQKTMKTQGILKKKYSNLSQILAENQKIISSRANSPTREMVIPELVRNLQKLCEELFTKFNATTRNVIGENLLGTLLLSTFFQQFDIFIYVFYEKYLIEVQENLKEQNELFLAEERKREKELRNLNLISETSPEKHKDKYVYEKNVKQHRNTHRDSPLLQSPTKPNELTDGISIRPPSEERFETRRKSPLAKENTELKEEISKIEENQEKSQPTDPQNPKIEPKKKKVLKKKKKKEKAPQNVFDDSKFSQNPEKKNLFELDDTRLRQNRKDFSNLETVPNEKVLDFEILKISEEKMEKVSKINQNINQRQTAKSAKAEMPDYMNEAVRSTRKVLSELEERKKLIMERYDTKKQDILESDLKKDSPKPNSDDFSDENDELFLLGDDGNWHPKTASGEISTDPDPSKQKVRPQTSTSAAAPSSASFRKPVLKRPASSGASKYFSAAEISDYRSKQAQKDQKKAQFEKQQAKKAEQSLILGSQTPNKKKHVNFIPNPQTLNNQNSTKNEEKNEEVEDLYPSTDEDDDVAVLRAPEGASSSTLMIKTMIDRLQDEVKSKSSIILSLSFLQGIDFEDEKNQYTLVQHNDGAGALFKIIDAYSDHKIKLVALAILEKAAVNPFVQLRFAKDDAMRILLENLKESGSSPSSDSVSILALICNILALACERVLGRKFMRRKDLTDDRMSGLEKIILVLKQKLGIYRKYSTNDTQNTNTTLRQPSFNFKSISSIGSDAFSDLITKSKPSLKTSANEIPNSNVSSSSNLKNLLLASRSSSNIKNNRSKMLITKASREKELESWKKLHTAIKAATTAFWYASKSNHNRAIVAASGGIECLALLLSVVRGNDLELLVPTMGVAMNCIAAQANYPLVRTKIATYGILQKVLELTQKSSEMENSSSNSNVTKLRILLAGTLYSLAEDDTAKMQLYATITILGNWLRTTNMLLLSYVTGVIWRCTSEVNNAKKLFDEDIYQNLVSLLTVGANSGNVSVPEPPRPLLKKKSSHNFGMMIGGGSADISEPGREEIRKQRDEQTFNSICSFPAQLKHQKADEIIKINTCGVLANCAKLLSYSGMEKYQEKISQSGVIELICKLLTKTLIPQLLVNCLKIVGILAAYDKDAFKKTLENEGLRSLWSLLKNSKAEVQCAAAQAICELVTSGAIAETIGAIYVEGLSMLVRLLRSTENEKVIAHLGFLIFKMCQSMKNRAIMSEEGAAKELALIIKKYSNSDVSKTENDLPDVGEQNSADLSVIIGQFGGNKATTPEFGSLEQRIKNRKMLKSNIALAISEIAKEKDNKFYFYQQNCILPLVNNLKEIDKNSETSIMDLKFSSSPQKLGLDVEQENLERLLRKRSFSFKSTQKKKEKKNSFSSSAGLKNENEDEFEFEESNLKNNSKDSIGDEYQMFSNTALALSVLSEEKAVALMLRELNTVPFLVKLLSSPNEGVQKACAFSINQIRKFYHSADDDYGVDDYGNLKNL